MKPKYFKIYTFIYAKNGFYLIFNKTGVENRQVWGFPCL